MNKTFLFSGRTMRMGDKTLGFRGRFPQITSFLQSGWAWLWIARPICLAASLLCAAPVRGQQPIPEPASRFCVMDIFVDSKAAPLAAYQLEFAVTNGVARIVGIEGGEHPAFHEPPFYDPKAMQHERVIIAAFNTASADRLPSGKTRVATIHFQAPAVGRLEYELKLQAAGNATGARIAAEATFEERKSQ